MWGDPEIEGNSFSTLPVIWLPTVTSAFNGDPCFSLNMLCSASRKVTFCTHSEINRPGETCVEDRCYNAVFPLSRINFPCHKLKGSLIL